ncbi:three component ABC system middle component [Photorhabdus laumondii]
MLYKDSNIINNSSLACFLLVYFVEQYENCSVNDDHPDLMKLLLVLPIVWHKVSRESIKKKKKTTPLIAVVQESPLIKSNLAQRVSEYAGASIQGLNLAVSSGLLMRLIEHGETRFETNFSKWPGRINKLLPKEMVQTITRLANWFSCVDTPSIYRLLLGN